jgi:hypothetical protein
MGMTLMPVAHMARRGPQRVLPLAVEETIAPGSVSKVQAEYRAGARNPHPIVQCADIRSPSR